MQKFKKYKNGVELREAYTKNLSVELNIIILRIFRNKVYSFNSILTVNNLFHLITKVKIRLNIEICK